MSKNGESDADHYNADSHVCGLWIEDGRFNIFWFELHCLRFDV